MDSNKIYSGLVFALVVANFFAWQAVFGLSAPALAEVNFFNVGQGDASFIETPQGIQVLVDGGPDNAIIQKLSQEMPFYDSTIDLMVLTHPEKDHITGLLEVLKRYDVKNILWTGVVRDNAEWGEWVDLIKKENAKIFIAQAGQRIILQKSEPEISIEIIFPKENLEGREIENTSNDAGIVTLLKIGKERFLFTGDISEKTEIALDLENIKADVLKVAHHGSKYSSSENFLAAVSPQFAVIPVGKNSYGHPTPEVLQRLAEFAINIFRTDKNGDIKFISDGNFLKIINPPAGGKTI